MTEKKERRVGKRAKKKVNDIAAALWLISPLKSPFTKKCPT